MNFYVSALVPLIIFTPLFYLNWNRVDKVVEESLFARFLFFGLLLGIIYAVLFFYSFITLYRYIDLMLFAIMLFLPLLAAGEQLSVVTGKYRSRKDIIQLSSSLGTAFSLPVAFAIGIVTEPAILPNYIFLAMIVPFAFLTNLMSGVILAIGATRSRVLLYYNVAFLMQMLFSSAIFIDYLTGSYAILTLIPEIGVAVVLYMKFFHERLSEI